MGGAFVVCVFVGVLVGVFDDSKLVGLQDRFCIHASTQRPRNTTADLLSVEDVVACMAQQIGTPGQGCDGGDPQNAMVYALLRACGT